MNNFSFLLLFVVFLLSACSTMEIKTSAVDLPEIHAPTPSPLNMKTVQWRVLNRSELVKLLDAIDKNKDTNFVIYALTPDGFESLNGNILELRRYILEQKEEITFYQEIQKPVKQN